MDNISVFAEGPATIENRPVHLHQTLIRSHHLRLPGDRSTVPNLVCKLLRNETVPVYW